MRWLEGWLGIVAGGLTLLAAILTAVFPIGGSTNTMTVNGVVTQQTTTIYTIWNVAGVGAGLAVTLIPTALALAILVGVALDLRGRRTLGRLLLLTGATLLTVAPYAPVAIVSAMRPGSPPDALIINSLVYVPLGALAIIAGIVACLRRDPRPTAPVAAPIPAPLAQ